MNIPFLCKRPQRCATRLESGRRAWALVFATAFASLPAMACGPDFPNRYLDAPAAVFLEAPEAFFAQEIGRLRLEGVSLPRAVIESPEAPRGGLLAAERADLCRALGERGVSRENADRIAWAYEELRRRIESEGATSEEATWPTLAEGTPREFALYLEGAVAWRRGETARALTAWRAILELPANERRYRTVWATYMLGREAVRRVEVAAESWSTDERAAAAREAEGFFQEVRRLVAEGAGDPLGLAAASLGWEARACLRNDDPGRALALYLQQHVAGDPGALESLRLAARATVAAQPEVRDALAVQPLPRRIVIAYLIARGGPWAGFSEDGEDFAAQARAWALACRKAGVADEPQADRLAWLAYEGGLFELAAQWAELAPARAPVACWLRGKLALRAGRLSEAGEHLEVALAAGPTDLAEAHRDRIWAELGRVRLAQDRFKDALEAYAAGGHAEDAGYVAERCLTLEEAREWATAARERLGGEAASRAPWRDVAATTCDLVARRLARAGRSDEATALFSAELRPVFVNYTAQVRMAYDTTKPSTERARAFWQAAQLLREHGMELIGTELEPDWTIWGGSFELASIATTRRDELALTGGLLAPTRTELERLAAQRMPEQRFHYRYRAADLAWWAAALLPNDSDETAQILHTAGGWLKARDPQAANRFYQALVIRCGQTPLGRAAAKKRWFAPVETAPAQATETAEPSSPESAPSGARVAVST